MIDGKIFLDQPVKTNKIMYENIRKIVTGQSDDYTTGCLLDYIYFKNYYKTISADLSKQQVLQQINFTANIERDVNTRFYFIFQEAKETVFEFSQETVKVL